MSISMINEDKDESKRLYRPTLDEDSYDEVNRILREIAYDDGVNYETAPKRILVGSGEDCQIVLFGGNYKEVYRDEV